MDQLLSRLRTTEEICRRTMPTVNGAIDKGLNAETHAAAKVKCYPTYAQKLPSSGMSGFFLAVDLGGTNFRVLGVSLRGNKEPHVVQSSHEVKEKLQRGSGEALFDFVAMGVWTFLEDYKLDASASSFKLGFTFSFPLKQEGLSRARLVRWTKGFNCTGVVKQDVGQLLQEALVRKKGSHTAHIDVVAVINDTTGTLMACARKFACCRIGVINGTGFNVSQILS